MDNVGFLSYLKVKSDETKILKIEKECELITTVVFFPQNKLLIVKKCSNLRQYPI